MNQEEQNENTQPTTALTTNQITTRENLNVWAFTGDSFDNALKDKTKDKIKNYESSSTSTLYIQNDNYLFYAEYDEDNSPPHFFQIFNNKYIAKTNFTLHNRDKSHKCIFLVKHLSQKNNYYILVYTFGYGHHLIEKENCIHEFGIISFANMLDSTQLKKLERDDGTASINVQSKKNRTTSEIESYYNNNLKSITKKLGGKIDKKNIGNNTLFSDISSTEGGMSLKFSMEVNDDILLNKLPQELIIFYEKENYKKIKDIDLLINSVIVESKDLATKLDTELYNYIKNSNEVFIAYDDEYIDFSFEINDKKNKQIFTDNIFNKTFTSLDNFRDEIIDHIKSHSEPYFKDMLTLKITFNSEIKSNVRLNQLFDLTIDFDNETYFRYSGKWKVYIDKYCNRVNHLFNKFIMKNNKSQIQKYTFDKKNGFNSSSNKFSENTYNNNLWTELDNIEKNRYYLFDCNNVTLGNGTSVEICDIHDKKENIFYHIKRYNNKTVSLHYLFFQGTSSELFMQYKTLDEKNRINEAYRAKTGDYINKKNIKIYFGVITNTGLRKITLKSKISFLEHIRPLIPRYGEDNIKIFRINDNSKS